MAQLLILSSLQAECACEAVTVAARILSVVSSGYPTSVPNSISSGLSSPSVKFYSTSNVSTLLLISAGFLEETNEM
jgi:hypothetical protein